MRRESESVLDRIRIASPCPADWDAMEGDERVRFCRECGKNVYNLGAMTRPEAEDLIRSREGKLCARFARRRDGTVLTRDCPVGRRGLRRALLLHAGGIAALFGLIPGIGALVSSEEARARLWESETFQRLAAWLRLEPLTHPQIMGRMAVPRPGQILLGEVPASPAGEIVILPAPAPPEGNNKP